MVEDDSGRGLCEWLMAPPLDKLRLKVVVPELARKKGRGPLLSAQEVEPIVPVRLLVEHGHRLTWGVEECNIDHQKQESAAGEGQGEK